MAGAGVRVEQRPGVAVLVLDAPPVNALGHGLRAALSDALDAALADPETHALLLTGAGRLFSAGADIREFDDPAGRREPILGAICARIDAAPKPVIALLNGAALGGGAELALACHYRLAVPEASLGLPEVLLGLVPGAGGTQLLPRLAGPEAALSLMLSGRTVGAAEAAELGLVDGVLTGDPVAAGVSFAAELAARGLGPRPSSRRGEALADAARWMAVVAAARDSHRHQGHAPARIADCVEATLLLPAEAGRAFERAAFEDCLSHPESRALRHLFMAERRADPALLARGARGRRDLTPAGEALAARLFRAELAAAEALVLAGQDVRLIDAALVDAGFPMGPMGGSAGGAGAAGAPILRRINAAVVAEGCRLIAEGAAGDAATVDVIAVHGLAYPRRSGGPMHMAEIQGLARLRTDMAAWQGDNPVWSVPPLLDEAVKYAAGFAALSPA